MNDLIYLMHCSVQKLQIVFNTVITCLFAFKIAGTTEPFYHKVENTVHGTHIKLAGIKWWIQVSDTKCVWALGDCLEFCWISNNGNFELNAPKAWARFLLKLHCFWRVARLLIALKEPKIVEFGNQINCLCCREVYWWDWISDRIGEVIGIESILLDLSATIYTWCWSAK